MMRYTLIRSDRKTVAVQITPAGEVILRCPRRMPLREAEAFLKSRESWVRKHLAQIAARPQAETLTEEDLRALAARAKADLTDRVERFAPEIGVSWGRVTIRSQRSRWGSCSAKGNLNFNCLLMLCPEEVRDYVVVHELCHRKVLNHSPRFWAEVSRVMPEYVLHRRWLKEQGGGLIARLP